MGHSAAGSATPLNSSVSLRITAVAQGAARHRTTKNPHRSCQCGLSFSEVRPSGFEPLASSSGGFLSGPTRTDTRGTARFFRPRRRAGALWDGSVCYSVCCWRLSRCNPAEPRAATAELWQRLVVTDLSIHRPACRRTVAACPRSRQPALAGALHAAPSCNRWHRGDVEIAVRTGPSAATHVQKLPIRVGGPSSPVQPLTHTPQIPLRP